MGEIWGKSGVLETGGVRKEKAVKKRTKVPKRVGGWSGV
jgi:hypothetical protein